MASPENREDEFNCPICLDLFLKPTQVSCGHVFCEPCLQPYLPLASPKCPLCRAEFDPKMKMRAKDVDRKMSQTKTNCVGCKKKMSFNKLRQHASSCSKVAKTETPKPFASSSSTGSDSDIVNRSTFQCPFCGLRNLDCADIIRHCNRDHMGNRAAVVCPICAVMPWGDPGYKSKDFLGHLNLRHKYEYDTYVDFHANEDDTLQKVLQASLDEK
ncbi:E3 ubiquitin-protein ligase RNF166-like isoform X2 [Apostichopus japonicus]|uniref:E3 ubiquitin-protein ligase RNF166-like isoform X2 n=1 Tax=Stichopus japonicus TaxID=307972 RepID=UPI003AB63DF4